MAGIHFDQVVSRGCGMDIHKKVVVATVQGEGICKETKSFDTFTSSLTQLRKFGNTVIRGYQRILLCIHIVMT